MIKLFGLNWKTTLSGIGNNISSLLLFLSLIPYSLPSELSTMMSPDIKRDVLVVGLVAKAILGTWNAVVQKDKGS